MSFLGVPSGMVRIELTKAECNALIRGAAVMQRIREMIEEKWEGDDIACDLALGANAAEEIGKAGYVDVA